MSKTFPIFQNPDSEGGSFSWPGRKDNHTAILLFHGFTATTVEVRPLANYFHKLGYHVSGPLLPGHGVSPEELNQVNYQDWIDKAEFEYQKLAGQYEKVFVGGESMGGLLTLWLASEHPEIDGIMVFAPAFRIPSLWLSELVWPFMRYKPKNNVDLSSPWQGFNVVPMKAAMQLFRLQLKIKRKLRSVKTPAIIFQGKQDTTIDPKGAVEVLEKISSTKKEMVWLEESSHCILLDKQLELVQSLCLDFVIGN
jgi:carboxylesterase